MEKEFWCRNRLKNNLPNENDEYINNNINNIIKEELIIDSDDFIETDVSSQATKGATKIVNYIKRKRVGRSPDWWMVTLIYCPKCKTTRGKKCREKFKTCETCSTKYIYQCANCLRHYDKLSGVRDHINLRCKKQKKTYKHYENQIKGHKIKNKCSRCFKIFSQKSEKLEHEKYCEDELGLKCGYCVHKAQNRRYLRLHIREHHSELFKVRFEKYEAMMCAHCNYKAFKKYLLIDHLMDRHHPDKMIHKPSATFSKPPPQPPLPPVNNSIQISPMINYVQYPQFINILPKNFK